MAAPVRNYEKELFAVDADVSRSSLISMKFRMAHGGFPVTRALRIHQALA
jgi:hypothetical protein